MKEHKVTISYNEPRIAEIEIMADDDIEAEDLAVKQFEQSYPEAIDIEIDKVEELE